MRSSSWIYRTFSSVSSSMRRQLRGKEKLEMLSMSSKPHFQPQWRNQLCEFQVILPTLRIRIRSPLQSLLSKLHVHQLCHFRYTISYPSVAFYNSAFHFGCQTRTNSTSIFAFIDQFIKIYLFFWNLLILTYFIVRLHWKVWWARRLQISTTLVCSTFFLYD